MVDKYNYLYLDVIETVKTAALSLTRVMREKQLLAHELHTSTRGMQQDLVEARKQYDAAERNAKSAEDELATARQNVERKVRPPRRELTLTAAARSRELLSKHARPAMCFTAAAGARPRKGRAERGAGAQGAGRGQRRAQRRGGCLAKLDS